MVDNYLKKHRFHAHSCCSSLGFFSVCYVTFTYTSTNTPRNKLGPLSKRMRKPLPTYKQWILLWPAFVPVVECRHNMRFQVMTFLMLWSDGIDFYDRLLDFNRPLGCYWLVFIAEQVIIEIETALDFEKLWNKNTERALNLGLPRDSRSI